MLWHKGSGLSDGGSVQSGDALAQAAVEDVAPGMIVGVGAGKTASRGIRELGRRHAAGELDGVRVVPASDAAESLCVELGLRVEEGSSFEAVDVLIDGADEVDRSMRMLKGSRGAVARERILAAASDRRIYLVPAWKSSERVGTNASLAIALMPFGISATRAAIRRLGLHGILRLDLAGGLLVTDNGNVILDADLTPDVDLDEIGRALLGVPGVVEHGLFLEEADRILIEHDDGAIERIDRGGDGER